MIQLIVFKDIIFMRPFYIDLPRSFGYYISLTNERQSEESKSPRLTRGYENTQRRLSNESKSFPYLSLLIRDRAQGNALVVEKSSLVAFTAG